MERKGDNRPFLKFLQGHQPTPEAFGIFLHEVIIIRVWSWFFAHCNHGEGCCSIAMGLGRRLPRSGITKYSVGGGGFFILSITIRHALPPFRGWISHFGCLFFLSIT